MTNTKLNYNGIWKQNVSTSENALKKHHFCEWTQRGNYEKVTFSDIPDGIIRNRRGAVLAYAYY